jgi:hypothetical protein
MPSTLTAALIALFLLPAAAMAQTATQTAAVDNAAPAASAPAVGSSMNSSTGGITRDQFIQRAKDRAAQRATARFDQIDANHDGILGRDEVRAWRTQHPRRAAAQPAQPTPQ